MVESLTLSNMITGASAAIFGSGSGLGTHKNETSLAPMALNLREVREMLRRMLPKFVSARTNRLNFFGASSPSSEEEAIGLMNKLPETK